MTRATRFGAVLLFAGLAAGCAETLESDLRDPTDQVMRQLDSQPPLGLGANVAAPAGAPRTAGLQRRPIQGFVKHAANRPGAAGSGQAAAAGGGDEISLEFENADLADFVRVVMEEGLRANYVLDPKVTGKVTMRTNRPLRGPEILPTLEEVLRLNNAALVERDGVFRIIPRAEAGLSAPLLTTRAAAARGMTMRVTPLRFVTVADISEVLEGVAPVAGAIRYDQSRNIVFSIGAAAEQTTIMDMIDALDVNYFAGRSFALKPLRDADPSLVVDELSAAFATPSGGDNPAIRFVPIQRMNAILVIAEDAPLLDEAVSFIRRLDQGGEEKPRLHLFAVHERRATELAVILGGLFDASVKGASTEAGAVAPGLSRDATSTGDESGSDSQPDSFFDNSENSGAGSSAVEASIDASTGQDQLTTTVNTGGDGALSASSGVYRIVADESSNAIIALATAEGARSLENALRRLDVRPLQVMIEATLVEVALNDKLEYGVRWFLQSGNFGVNFGDVANPGADSLFPGFNAAFQTTDIQATLSALDSVSDVKVLSSPTLMVLDNQTARLQIGDQVPIVTRSAQSTEDADAALVTEEEYRDTGVILEIRPTVSEGGAVTLEIRQEVSDVVDSSGASNPTIAQRLVESTVAVQSGDTIALAGLIEEKVEDGRDGIPVLSRLPVVGPAFGLNVQNAERSELLVLIKPIVVRDQAGARAATEELRRKLTSMQPRPKKPADPVRATTN